ncbi:MAG: hypothetical protein WCR06_12010 [bacterium]
MQIKIETTETAAGPMHDLVLVQGRNTIRLGLVVDDAQQALRELSVWLEDNTMDVAEVVAEGERPRITRLCGMDVDGNVHVEWMRRDIEDRIESRLTSNKE